jgi:hypothetical protein
VEPTSARPLIRLLSRSSRGPKRLALERWAALLKTLTPALVALTLASCAYSPSAKSTASVVVYARDATELHALRGMSVSLSCERADSLVAATNERGVARFTVPRGVRCEIASHWQAGHLPTENFTYSFAASQRKVAVILVSRRAALVEDVPLDPPARGKRVRSAPPN